MNGIWDIHQKYSSKIDYFGVSRTLMNFRNTLKVKPGGKGICALLTLVALFGGLYTGLKIATTNIGNTIVCPLTWFYCFFSFVVMEEIFSTASFGLMKEGGMWALYTIHFSIGN